MEEAVNVVNATKVYTDAFGRPKVTAVKDLTFCIQRGEVFGLLGPNGAGKTTTIRMISGLLIPTSGTITVAGHNVITRRSGALRKLGVVLEGTRNVYWRLTAWENMEYFGTLRGVWDPRVLRANSERWLKFFGLFDVRNKAVNSFSRGMKQKLAIAIALVTDPEVILLDEPTLGLDVYAAHDLKALIKKLAEEEGKTVILTTHAMDVAQELSDRVCIISSGRVVALDTVKNLLSLFSVQRYRFTVHGRLTDGQKAALFSMPGLELKEEPEHTIVGVNLDAPESFYEIIRVFESARSRITSVVKEDPNLEEVFMRITGKASRKMEGGDGHEVLRQPHLG